jgi:hypothetical protein
MSGAVLLPQFARKTLFLPLPISRLVKDSAYSNLFCYALVCGVEWSYCLSWFCEVVVLGRFLERCVFLRR